MTVTMIIAAYNAEATIERAVTSALADPEITQVIVVDDASTDNTATIAARQDDSTGRLMVLRQPANAGPSAARNRALDAATGEWIGVLDADDFLLPGRTAGLLEYTDNADMIADDLWQVQEDDVHGERRLLLDDSPTEPRKIGFTDFVLSNVTQTRRQRAELGFIKPIMRREFLTDENLRYKEHMRLGEDFELYARALALGARLRLVPAQGYVSVVRKNSLSSRHSETDLMHLRDSDITLHKDLALTALEKNALRQHYLSVDCRLQWRLLINAVKNRDIKAALATFGRPYPVPVYLLARLVEQAYLRSSGKGPAR